MAISPSVAGTVGHIDIKDTHAGEFASVLVDGYKECVVALDNGDGS